MRHNKPDSYSDGFTLIELMITLAIAALILSLAVPSLRDFTLRNNLAAKANELVSTLNYARSEAVRRGETITVTSNNGNAWEDGWQINDADANLLRTIDAMNGPTLAADTDTVQYLASGFTSAGASVTFTLCYEAGQPGRQIEITATGRPAIDADYTCP